MPASLHEDDQNPDQRAERRERGLHLRVADRMFRITKGLDDQFPVQPSFPELAITHV